MNTCTLSDDHRNDFFYKVRFQSILIKKSIKATIKRLKIVPNAENNYKFGHSLAN